MQHFLIGIIKETTKAGKVKALQSLSAKHGLGDILKLDGSGVLALSKKAGKPLTEYENDHSSQGLDDDDAFINYLFEKLF